VQIEHQPAGDLKNRIRSESLSFNGQPVVEFDGKEVRLHADDGSGDTTWPFPLPRSAISFFPAPPGTRRLACFRNHVSCIRVFSPNPKVMGGLVKKPDSHPERSPANFAEWLFAMQAADFKIGVALANSLREATEDHACQILIISHHPELINQLAAHSGTLFERSESGTTTCRRFEWRDQEHATPAELVARGWE
jgi:hypothetical protein